MVIRESDDAGVDGDMRCTCNEVMNGNSCKAKLEMGRIKSIYID